MVEYEAAVKQALEAVSQSMKEFDVEGEAKQAMNDPTAWFCDFINRLFIVKEFVDAATGEPDPDLTDSIEQIRGFSLSVLTTVILKEAVDAERN